MSDLWTTVVGAVVILGLTAAAVWLYQRSLAKPGGRDGLGGAADMFANFIDVFHPEQSRARDALREIEHSGPVTPVPDDLDDDPVRLLTNPDGTPRAVRIRRPR